MENLARYIIREFFSPERMKSLDYEAIVIYTAKDGMDQKVFPLLEWLDTMRFFIPNRVEQWVRYSHC
jgi:hypothetical protein